MCERQRPPRTPCPTRSTGPPAARPIITLLATNFRLAETRQNFRLAETRPPRTPCGREPASHAVSGAQHRATFCAPRHSHTLSLAHTHTFSHYHMPLMCGTVREDPQNAPGRLPALACRNRSAEGQHAKVGPRHSAKAMPTFSKSAGRTTTNLDDLPGKSEIQLRPTRMASKSPHESHGGGCGRQARADASTKIPAGQKTHRTLPPVSTGPDSTTHRGSERSQPCVAPGRIAHRRQQPRDHVHPLSYKQDLILA